MSDKRKTSAGGNQSEASKIVHFNRQNILEAKLKSPKRQPLSNKELNHVNMFLARCEDRAIANYLWQLAKRDFVEGCYDV